jgi:hypothetical protein
MWEGIDVYRVMLRKPEGKRSIERDSGVNDKIILRWIFRSGMWGNGLD